MFSGLPTQNDQPRQVFQQALAILRAQPELNNDLQFLNDRVHLKSSREQGALTKWVRSKEVVTPCNVSKQPFCLLAVNAGALGSSV